MNDLFILIITPILSAITTGSITYIFTVKQMRKKATAEAKGAELDNVEKAVKIWRELSEKLNIEVDDLKKRIAEIEKYFCINAPECENLKK